jgi:uncharacterized protein (DUF4415 family)
MEFEWDPTRNAECIARRGINFVDAVRIFEGSDESLPAGGAAAVSAKRTKKVFRVAELPPGRTDWKRVSAMTEEEIMATSPPELADLPPDFWDSAIMVPPLPKHAISIRVDEDVLSWFKRLGPRYQTRMNAVLRSYMKSAESKPRTRRGA